MSKLKISKITYSELRSSVEFENCRLEVEVRVGPDDDPRVEFEKCRRWVSHHVQEACDEMLEELESEDE